MDERRTIHSVSREIGRFFQENRCMPSYQEMIDILGVRSKIIVHFWINKRGNMAFILSMPLRTAYKLCPHVIFLPVDYDAYVATSHQFKTVLKYICPIIEDVGIDEALDISGLAEDSTVIAFKIKGGNPG